jgi:hypothetical protein
VTLQVRGRSAINTVTGMARRFAPLANGRAAGQADVNESNEVRLRGGRRRPIGFFWIQFLSVGAGFARVGAFRHS